MTRLRAGSCAFRPGCLFPQYRAVRVVEGVIPSDTSSEAAAIQQEIFRRMTTAQRLRLALEMSESMRNVALAGLRSRRPELNAEQMRRDLMRVMYGFTPQS